MRWAEVASAFRASGFIIVIAPIAHSYGLDFIIGAFFRVRISMPLFDVVLDATLSGVLVADQMCLRGAMIAIPAVFMQVALPSGQSISQ
jgi:hypothetical protein